MRTYAAWLFGAAALFNAAVGLALMFGGDALGAVLGLAPVLPASASVRGGPAQERVYAPYYEAYLAGSLAHTAIQSNVRFATLAFVQAATKTGPGACTLTWNGDKKIFQLVEKPTRSAFSDFPEDICVWSETRREIPQ